MDAQSWAESAIMTLMGAHRRMATMIPGYPVGHRAKPTHHRLIP
jgi:hypothetical protein